MKMILKRKNYLLLPLFMAISCLNLSGMEDAAAKTVDEIDTSDYKDLEKGIGQDLKDLEKIDPEEFTGLVKDISADLEKEEREDAKKRNKIIWSIPAAFPADKFEENVKDLHVNIPFYGKVSLGKGFYPWYKKKLRLAKGSVKELYKLDLGEFAKGIHDIHGEFDQGFDTADKQFASVGKQLESGDLDTMREILQSVGGKSEVNVADLMKRFEAVGGTIDAHNIKGVYAPGAEYYEYLTGKNLIGTGIYKSDFKEWAFIAVNVGTEFLLFKDIKRAKLEKVKNWITANRDLCIDFMEKLQASAENPKEQQTIKKEFSTVITKQCSLFKYNPLKKEVMLPIARYLILQRIIEKFTVNAPPSLHTKPEQMYAYVKDETGTLVRSGVTPLSITKIAKLYFAPLRTLSETSRTTIYDKIKNLKMTDRFCGSFKLPSFCYANTEEKRGLPLKFYWFLSSIGGESLVLLMSIKILDSYFNKQLIDTLTTKYDELFETLKESKQLAAIAHPNSEEREQIFANDQKLEKATERAFSAGKTNFKSWATAKRATFSRITIAGLCCFVLPTVISKIAPIVKTMIKS